MSHSIYIKPLVDGQYQWWGHNDKASAEGELTTFSQQVGNRPVTFLLSGYQVNIERVAFSEAERKHVLKTTDYLLEEQLCEDIDELHICHAEFGSHSIVLAVMRQQLLSDLLAPLLAAKINVEQVLSEPLSLPYRDGGCTVLVDGSGECQLRYGINEGCSVDSALLGFYFDQLQQQKNIEHIICYAESDNPEVLALLEQYGDRIELRPLDQLRQAEPLASAVNLLQGEFSPSIDWSSIWQRWKLVTAVVACAFIANLAVIGAQISAVNNKISGVEQQQQQIFKTVFPSGRYSANPRRRFESELQKFGGGSSSNFLSLLSLVAEPASNDKQLQVKSLNYDAGNQEMNISVVADKFSQLEKLTQAVEERGVSAELLSSNNRDNKVVARMKFKESL
ncbi:type II secretion system protein GspL [Sinobacterium norvegicum]|uniref:type II secretion system protein GspL n=1 Tax=Sinobacterium norvegicum TaxID=1641715 RepID=UPI001F00E8E5|nr:type II secretion system protein GspL [Sinobacterium norvegicum]